MLYSVVQREAMEYMYDRCGFYLSGFFFLTQFIRSSKRVLVSGGGGGGGGGDGGGGGGRRV